jgi:hypothetical protein
MHSEYPIIAEMGFLVSKVLNAARTGRLSILFVHKSSVTEFMPIINFSIFRPEIRPGRNPTEEKPENLPPNASS